MPLEPRTILFLCTGNSARFEQALRSLRARFTLLLALSDENIDALALTAIGREGASAGVEHG